MIKAILFDADGVVIKAREVFFSQKIAIKQGVSSDIVRPFFIKDLRSAFIGKLDIKESLKNYLPNWKWQGSVEEFLKYWFEAESQRDEKVLEYVEEQRSKGIICYIATDREPYWADYLVNTIKLKEYFDGFFFSYDVGYMKDEKEFFIEVINRLKLKPEEIAYFDDDPKNVDVAKGVGINAILYKKFEDLIY